MKKKLKQLLKKRDMKLILWFLLRFNLLAIPLYIVILTNFSFQPLQVFIAQVSTHTLSAQGYNVAQYEQIITAVSGSSLYTIDVSWDSTGWKSLYTLFALVVATPISTMNRKLKFFLVGLPTIFVLNLVRIVTTVAIALSFGFQYFDVVHTLLWREGLIIAVIALWYVWLRREKYNIRHK